jgi:hypothetical protein
MTKNKAMKWSAFAGAIITGVAGGLALGPAGALLGGLGAAAVGFPMLFHDAPERRATKVKKAKETLGIQVADSEDPK